MVESPEGAKLEEQFPLLKVDGAGGDGGLRPPATPFAPQGWNITVTKKSWLERWPECMSACWMTLILLGITFLGFYALGMSAYRRQSVIVFTCNRTKPSSDVYMHQLVHASYVPFTTYSNYISKISSEYPQLTFHVIFLLDDSYDALSISKRSRLKYSMPLYANTLKLEDTNKKIKDFQSTHCNTNITVIPLSHYMATTPLKYKWKSIPVGNLPFYARLYSIWQNGGIGLDLATFNNHYSIDRSIDQRVAAIMKQHNDGIKTKEYTQALNNFEEEQDTEVFMVFCNLMNQIWNNTWSYLNRNQSMSPNLITVEKEKSYNDHLIRTHRNKRDTSASSKIELNSTALEEENNNASTSIADEVKVETPSNKIAALVSATVNKTDKIDQNLQENFTNVNLIPVKAIDSDGNSDTSQLVLYYKYFSISSDGVGPSYISDTSSTKNVARPVKSKDPNMRNTIKNSDASSLISIDANGSFISAVTREHPFIGQLISSRCFQLQPKYIIQDVVTQCYDMKNEYYCNNVYILNFA